MKYLKKSNEIGEKLKNSLKKNLLVNHHVIENYL